MRRAWFLALLLTARAAGAGQAPDATLVVTVADPSGAVIVGARVSVRPDRAPGGPVRSETTGGRGEAAFDALPPGRYAVHVESPGFEPFDRHDVRLRPGERVRREVTLTIARVAETIQVVRDPRERASDRLSDAFATVLGQSEINELPDDPDEMEQMLRDMAGPGATLRVNGFRGGKMPAKDQIQSIRFRRNMFAADAHEAGFVSVDIITKPGLDSWRGATNIGFRGDELSARNAFAPVKGDERRERFGFSLNGPLRKHTASLALAADGVNAFDSKTIVAALPSGYFADSVRRPNDTLNVSARAEIAVGKAHVVRAEFQRNHTFTDDLGVGDFDLPERAYSETKDERLVRVGVSGAPRKALFNEFRFQFRSEETAMDPRSLAPAVLVLNAFDAGGAQLAGTRGATEVEVADDLDVAAGRHAVRTGFLIDAGRYRSNELRNPGGSFTFASLDAYRAAAPTTFSRNVGDPRVEVALAEAGLYIQDDYRARKDLTISGGIRGEIQSHIGRFRAGPRGGVAWSPFRSGSTTVRAGGGIFFDWVDAESFEQAAQLDGAHQRVETVIEPGYPDPALGTRAIALPPGRVALAAALRQPELREAMVGIERTIQGSLRANLMAIHRTGVNLLRGVNINAPRADGTRADPASGPVTLIDSIAASRFDALVVGLNYARPEKRIFVAANYQWSRSFDDADSAFSLPADNFNLAAERGPAATDARNRFMSLANFPLAGRFRMATSIRVQSALPYDITTGRDDNGDTISNDRPAGVTRNAGRGTAQIDVGGRLSWVVGIGSRPRGGVGGPQVRIVRANDADPLAGAGGADGLDKRYTIELYAQAYNLLNHTNALNFSGVMTSPFFGRATSSGPPRRAEIGARFTF